MLWAKKRELTPEQVKALPPGTEVHLEGRDRHGELTWLEGHIVQSGKKKVFAYRIHRAVFPIRFPAEILGIANKAETVLDVFGGTGTTLIACEQSGKTCFMMELDPAYVDVIIDRWETFTGEKAVLIHEEG